MTSVAHHASPVEAVKAFLACVKTKDMENMRRSTHPNATACLIREGQPRFQALTEAIDRLGTTKDELVEDTWDEIEHVDGEYAIVWTNFSIHRNGQAGSHFACGIVTCLLISFIAPSNRIQFVFLLEKPCFRLGYPDYVRYCKTT